MAFKVFQSIQKPAISEGSAHATRRSFIQWWLVGWGLFAGSVGACVTMAGRFMMPNVLFEPPMSFRAGFPGEYQIGKVDTRFKKEFGVWIVRDEGGFYVLSVVCTHLGCTPNWLQADQKFKCPCHGSGFYKSGVNFEGPAPRPLERFSICIGADGQILVDKSAKFQEEKGQWTDPASYAAYTG